MDALMTGFFTWDGSNFSSSARDIVLEHREDGPWLCAYLRKIDGSESERQGIRLGDRIQNENGQLRFVVSTHLKEKTKGDRTG